MKRARWLGVGLLMACAPEEVEEAPLDPSDRGPFSVEFVETSLDLGDRGSFPSEVSVRIFSPATSGTVPILLVNHGFALAPRQYDVTLDHLASWGFQVVAPLWDAGIPTARTHRELAEDVSATIDWLYANALPTEASGEATQLGVFGHSRGGKQTIHAATLDDRIAVTLTFDPVDSLPPFGVVDEADFPSVTPELMAELAVPSGVIGTGYGGEGVGGGPACAPVEDNHQAYVDAMQPDTLHWVLPSAGHNDIVDDCAEGAGGFFCAACVPGDDPLDTRSTVAGIAVAFFSTELKGETGMGAWLDGTAEALVGATVSGR